MIIRNALNTVKTVVKAAKSGSVTWSEYCKPGNHDHKFGPSITEYLSQIPYLCIITLPLILIYWLIYYGAIFAWVSLTSIPDLIKHRKDKSDK